MDNSQNADVRQLTPVVHQSRATSLVRPSGQSRQSEVFCNVRHMLSYIDQVENENYRHAKAIEGQFQAIKQELYCALRNEQPIAGGAALSDDQQWEPLIDEMERDLHINQVTMSGIGKNLARLKEQIEEMKRSENGQKKSASLLATPRQPMSLQYRTPITNRIEYTPLVTVEASAESVPQIRRSLTSGPSPVDDVFKVPTFVPSTRRPLSTLTASSSKPAIKAWKRKLDQHKDSKFWHIEIKPSDSQRFINVIKGLPKDDPSQAHLSAEQYRKELEEAIGWIDRSHVVRKKSRSIRQQ